MSQKSVDFAILSVWQWPPTFHFISALELTNSIHRRSSKRCEVSHNSQTNHRSTSKTIRSQRVTAPPGIPLVVNTHPRPIEGSETLTQCRSIHILRVRRTLPAFLLPQPSRITTTIITTSLPPPSTVSLQPRHHQPPRAFLSHPTSVPTPNTRRHRVATVLEAATNTSVAKVMS